MPIFNKCEPIYEVTEDSLRRALDAANARAEAAERNARELERQRDKVEANCEWWHNHAQEQMSRAEAAERNYEFFKKMLIESDDYLTKRVAEAEDRAEAAERLVREWKEVASPLLDWAQTNAEKMGVPLGGSVTKGLLSYVNQLETARDELRALLPLVAQEAVKLQWELFEEAVRCLGRTRRVSPCDFDTIIEAAKSKMEVSDGS
ncbi:MAG: hypothetical protein KY445_07735 [Armatimonadetes bacterium]|nr:hypothetical protein [Armatimonadota bacterium]